MARICKTLIPEQGYAHRDHRSKKGMVQGHAYKKTQKTRTREILDERNKRDMDREELEIERQREQWNNEWQ